VTRRRGHRRAQALTEFALVLPIFLLILLGLFDVGRGVFIYNGLTNAAREAARLAIVNQDPTMVEQRAQDMAFGTEITNIASPTKPLVRFFRSQPNANDIEGNPQCSPVVVGCIAVIVANSTWTPITPIIGNIIGPIDLEAKSELSVELVCPNPAYTAYATSDLCPKQPSS
jgi:TadE-like protein